jgi:predicted nucleotidyltransferase
MDKKEILSYLQILKLELSEEGIDRVGLFGSMARGEGDLYSDIDIVIRTTPEFVRRFRGVSGFLFLEDLRHRIERRFGRKVDLCDEAGLKDRRVLEGVIYA